MRPRCVLPAAALVAVAVAVAAVAAAPAAAATPDLDVRRVADPVPTGQAGSYGLRLKATVVNAGDAPARASRLRFVLSADRRLDRGDTRMSRERVDALPPGARDIVSDSGRIPADVEAGIYHVLACVGDECEVAKETVAVTEPGGETAAQAGAPMGPIVIGNTSPRTEWLPEQHVSTPNTPNGMRVGDPIDCPASSHGQGDGRCVWVLTQYGLTDRGEAGRVRSDFWHCPANYPHPFEVALGFDPMWRDHSKNSSATVETVAGTRWLMYRNWLGREYFPSYAGVQSERGYVSITFTGAADQRWVHMAEYLCSTKRANAYLA
jgi:hypothetical protein